MNKNLERNDILNNIPNDNLINIANTIDMISLDDLNGTLMDNIKQNNIKIPTNIFNKDDNKSLIKSLTKEILANIKKNDNDINDNGDNDDENDNYNNYNENDNKNNKNNNYYDNNENNDINIKLKSKKIKKLKKENFNNSTMYGFFDNNYGIKDFILLFVIYFLLSQEMIKDFFSKYFTSLNADSEGKVNVQGVIIYGLILTVLFTISRKLVN